MESFSDVENIIRGGEIRNILSPVLHFSLGGGKIQIL